MKKIFIYLYLLVCIGIFAADFTHSQLLTDIFKPLIMITLGLHYCVVQRGAISKAVLLAIFFSCAGDVLLMLQRNGELYFMLGLGAFLVAHIFYILAYRQHQSEDTSNELRGVQRIRYAFPVILSGTGLVVVLFNHLGGLKFPVLVYAAVITSMTLTALFRFGRTNTTSFTMVFGGAILFMISDSLIAINKFLEPLPMAGFWIMLTYLAAQYLIVVGLAKHQNQTT